MKTRKMTEVLLVRHAGEPTGEQCRCLTKRGRNMGHACQNKPRKAYQSLDGRYRLETCGLHRNVLVWGHLGTDRRYRYGSGQVMAKLLTGRVVLARLATVKEVQEEDISRAMAKRIADNVDKQILQEINDERT